MALDDIKVVNLGTRQKRICNADIADKDWPFPKREKKPGKTTFVFRDGKMVEAGEGFSPTRL